MMQTLRRGSKGSEVNQLQTALKRAGRNLSIDGSYGPETEQAVKDFQQFQGITVDGIAGPVTQERLQLFMDNQSPDAISNALEDLDKTIRALPEYKELEVLLYG